MRGWLPALTHHGRHRPDAQSPSPPPAARYRRPPGDTKEHLSLKPLLSGIAAFAPAGSTVTVLSETPVPARTLGEMNNQNCSFSWSGGSATSRADLLEVCGNGSGFIWVALGWRGEWAGALADNRSRSSGWGA